MLLLDLCMAQGDASKHVPGLDMTKANLNTTLKAMKPEQKVLFEFYATWCPACRWVLLTNYCLNRGVCWCWECCCIQLEKKMKLL